MFKEIQEAVELKRGAIYCLKLKKGANFETVLKNVARIKSNMDIDFIIFDELCELIAPPECLRTPEEHRDFMLSLLGENKERR